MGQNQDMEIRTISVSKKTKDRFVSFAKYEDSQDSLLNKMIDAYEGKKK